MKKVGILAGTFNPIHQGHLAFGLAAIDVFGLNKIVFLPEAKPREKAEVLPLKHRLAMLKLAIKPYKKLDVVEISDERFSVAKTLPKLEKLYAGARLYLLVGSDVIPSVKKWPQANKLLKKVELIAGQRSPTNNKLQKSEALNIYTNFGNLSSSDIRTKLSKGKIPHGLEPKVVDYIQKNKLYYNR